MYCSGSSGFSTSHELTEIRTLSVWRIRKSLAAERFFQHE